MRRFAGNARLPGRTSDTRQPPVSRRAIHPHGQTMLMRTCACGGNCPHCSGAAKGPGLAVNAPGDAFEQEADRVADHVMRMPGAGSAGDQPVRLSSNLSLRRKCACGGDAGGCAGCKGEEETKLRRKATAPRGPATAPPLVDDVLRAPGRTLDAGTRGFMEARFGRDFGAVRVHHDRMAADSARAVGARAYTVGSNIAFADGEYRPGAESGRRLLAHELAHVVQQSGPAPAAMQRATDDTAEALPVDTNVIGDAGAGAEQLDTAKPLPKPNKAPGCADVCGDEAHCIREPSEACDAAMDTLIMGVWKKVATGLTNAVNNLDPNNLTPTALQSLKDNFKWAPGGTPADLPTKVLGKLNDAMQKITDNLCTKCVECPSAQDVAQIDQRRGENCTGFNCFKICKTLKDDKVAVHALTHELFHRVVPYNKALGDPYRGQSTYPGTSSTGAMGVPDTYASLIDDLQPATPAAKSPPGSPSSPPLPPTPAPRPAPPDK